MCVDLTVWLVGLNFRWTSLRYRKLRDLKNDRKGQGLVLVWYGMIDVWGFGVIWYDWLFELCSCTIDCSNYAPVEGVSLSNPLQWGFIYPVSCLWVTEWFPSKRTSSRQWFFGPRFVSWCLFVAGCFRDDGKQWEDAAWLAHESMRSNQLELDRVSQNPLMNRTIAGWPDLVFWVISGDDIW